MYRFDETKLKDAPRFHRGFESERLLEVLTLMWRNRDHGASGQEIAAMRDLVRRYRLTGLLQTARLKAEAAAQSSGAGPGRKRRAAHHWPRGFTAHARWLSRYSWQHPYRTGKEGDLAAARLAIDHLWTGRRDRSFTKLVDTERQTVFLTVPSSTGDNLIPVALAERLARGHGGIDIVSDEFFDALHSRPVKFVRFRELPFRPPRYQAVDDGELLRLIGDRTVWVVDDSISSGSSAHQFIKAVQGPGLVVDGVVSLMGYPRLRPLPGQIPKLRQALAGTGVDIKARELADGLTKGQVDGVLNRINNTMDRLDRPGGPEARERLLEDLWGLERRLAGEAKKFGEEI